VPHFKRPATRPAAKSTRPSVAWLDAPDALRRLPDGPASRGAACLPGATIRAIKWVIIDAPWYKTGHFGADYRSAGGGRKSLGRPIRGGPMNKVVVWGVAAAALVAFLLTLAGERGMLGDPPPAQQAADIGGPFSLIDSDGGAVTEGNFSESYLLVSFGFTSCPDVCPTALQAIGQAMDLLGEDGDRLQPLFITLDPERDTPEVVGSYTEAFHPRLIGLTGSVEQVAAAAGAYRVYFAKVPAAGDGGADYTIDHSALVYLMSPGGAYLTHFSHASTPEDIAAGVRGFLS
jgi:protein SCO1/2